MQSDNKTENTSDVVRRIRSVQNKLLDRVLAANTVYFAIIGAIILSNILAAKFRVVQFFLIILFIILTVTLLYRNRIAYNVKLFILLLLLNSSAIVSIYNFGLISGGRNFLMFSILFTSIFATRRNTTGVFIISIVILLTFMFLFVTGRVQLHFDIRNYTKNYYSWIIQISSFIVLIGILVLVSSSLFRKIKKLATESSEQVRQIRLLNDELENKVAL